MRDPAVHAAVCDDIAAFVAALGWTRARHHPLARSPAATAIGNSCSGRGVTERLTHRAARPSRRRHRRDAGGAVYRALRAARRDRRGRAGARPSGPPASAAGRAGKPRAHRADLSRISASAAAAPCSTGRGALSRLEARPRRQALAQAGLDAPVDDSDRCPRRRAAAAPCCMRAAAARCAARSASRRRARITSWRSTAARSWRRALAGAIEAAWAIAEALSARRKPLDIQVTATDAGLDVDVRGSGPLHAERHRPRSPACRRAAPARAPHPSRRMVVQRAAPTVAMGRAPCRAAARRISAGDRRRRGTTWRGSSTRHVQACANTSPTCSAGVGPFALRLAERARVTAADSDADAIAALQRAAAGDLGPEAGRRPGARPVPPAVHCRAELQVLRCRRVRSAAPGRGSAGTRARREQGADRGRRLVQCRDLRARRPHPGRRRLPGSRAVTPVDQFRYSAHVELVGAVSSGLDRFSASSMPPPQRSCHICSPMVQEMRGALGATPG